MSQEERPEDRRASPRVPLALHVRVGKSVQLYLARDLSADGVFLFTPTPEDVGTELSLALELPDRSVLSLNGAVVRTQQVKEVGAGFGMSGMAVKFTNVPEDDHRRLVRLVDSVRDALDGSSD